MKGITYNLILTLLFLFGCVNNRDVDITPHDINPQANEVYVQALQIIQEYYDVDSTLKSIELLNVALDIDSLNPDYYGVKAKLFAEMGLLDSALFIQKYASEIGAINGEYFLQLGLFQAAKGLKEESIESFKKSNNYLTKVLKLYPDSLGAFVNQQAANSLYHGIDSLFMTDKRAIRARFPDRLMEVEMTRRLKPSTLIKQIKNIETESINDLIFEIDKEHFLNKENEEK